MKTLLSLLGICLMVSTVHAQTPEKMSYQAVVRNVSNALITDSDVGVQISILFETEIGPVVYAETHSVTTNANGLMTLEVGMGTVLTGDLGTIDWANGPYFIKSEIDPEGGTDYSITGVSQLITVPYAFYSDKAGEAVYADSIGIERSYIYLRKKATPQLIPNSSNQTIKNYDEIDSAHFSLNNVTGVITFNYPGTYIITAQTSFSTAGYPGRKLMWLYCECENYPARIAPNEQDVDALRMSTSFVGNFEEGDEISLGVFQASGISVEAPNNTQIFDEIMVNIEKLR